MKKIKLIFSVFILFTTIYLEAQITNQIVSTEAPIITFKQTIFNWGTIKEGEKTEFDVEFTNTGKTDLLITKIKGSCGCTVPSNWKKEAIKPGETSSFHIVFNSRNKPNKQQKTVTIMSNTAKGRDYVKVKGMVIPDPVMQKKREERRTKSKVKRRVQSKKKELSVSKTSNNKFENKVNPKVAPIMTFKQTVFNWGTIKEGEKTEFDVEFTNTGKTDLLITKIRGSCGCTVPSNWKKEAIKPGETSSFHIVFNSRNKPNKQQKTITITCNTIKGKERIVVKGMVIPDPAMQKIRNERKAKRKVDMAKRKEERNKKLINEKKGTVEESEAVDKSNSKQKNKIAKKHKKSIKKVKKESDKNQKELKKAQKQIEKLEKETKKKEKIQGRVNDARKKVTDYETKLLKMQSKFKKLERRGKLSPQDIEKRKEAMDKQIERINKAKTKLQKAKQKLY